MFTDIQTNVFNELNETKIKYRIKTVRQFKGHTGPCMDSNVWPKNISKIADLQC